MKKVSAYETFANEGVRTKMTPISSEDMTRKIGNLSGYRLVDFVHRAITSHDRELIGNIIKHANIGSLNNNDKISVIESAIIFDERDVLRWFLDKGLDGDVLDEILKSAYRFADYKSASLIRRYMRANESLRDKMTPKSKAEIEERIDGLGIKSVPFREIIKVCSEKYESVSMKRINDHSFRYTFRENGLLYTVACWHLSTHGKDNHKMKLIVSEGRHRPESIFVISCMDDVVKIVRKGKEVIRNLEFERERDRFFGINESVRDEMTPKTRDEIRSDLRNLDVDEKLVRGAMNGMIWVVEEAIESGGNIHVQNDIALREASLYGHVEMVKFLLSKGANVKPYHYEAERWATQKGHTELIQILVQARKKCELATHGKLKESLRDMMTPKSEEDIENSVKDITLYRAGKLYSSMVVRTAGRVSDKILKHLPLIIKCHQEVFFDSKLEVDKYLKEGWKYNDYKRQTEPEDMLKLSFEVTVKNNKKKILVSQHKDTNYLHCSFINPSTNKLDITKLRTVRDFKKLLNEMVFLNESVRDKMTAKTETDIREYVSTLTQHEKDVKLLEVCLKQHMDWVKVLLAMGANPNYIHIKDGNTLIFRVCMGGIVSHPDLNIVRMLLEAGADPTVPNCRGIDTLKWAKCWKKWDIVELIEPYYNKGVNESVRDMMTPKSEKQGIDEFRKLDKSDMVNSLYSECIEMFDPNPPMDSTPVVTDGFCEFLKKEVGFDVWTTFLPEYRKYINYDMVLDDLTEEQLIRLFQLIYDRKINESLRNKMTPKRVDDIRDSLGKLSKDELNDRLVRAVTGNDLETLEVLLPYVDLNYEGQALELFELSIDLYHMGVFGLLLDKDHSRETIDYVRDYIESHFGDSPTHRRMWLGLFKKYEGKTRVSE